MGRKVRGGERGAARLGARCSTPRPTAPAGGAGCFSRRPFCGRGPDPSVPGPPDPNFEFGWWLVTASRPEPGDQRIFASYVLLMPAHVAFLWSQKTAALRGIFGVRVMGRDNKRLELHGFCYCARSSRRCSGTRRFVTCCVSWRMPNGRRLSPVQILRSSCRLLLL